MIVLRLSLFVLDAGSVLFASGRVAAALTARAGSRALVTATVAACCVILETLGLGLIHLGTSSPALTIAALLTAATAYAFSRGRGTRAVYWDAWQRQDYRVRAVMSGILGVLVLWTVWLLWHPVFAVDASRYHLGEPVLWLVNGRPGSWQPTNASLPDQADPKNFEALVVWALALARTPIVIVPMVMSILALVPVATATGLSRLGVPRLPSIMFGLALVGVPYVGASATIVTNDTAALCWLLCGAALAAASAEEPALLAVAAAALGVAVGTKTTTLPVAAVVVILVLVHRRDAVRSVAKPVAVGALIGLFLSAVWLVQTTVHFGAPLYPFSRAPDGPPLPANMRYAAARFISDPVGAIRVGRPKAYSDALGGGLLLLLALPLEVVASFCIDGRRSRRVVRWSCLAAVIALFAWSVSPETGLPSKSGLDYLIVGTGVRFMFPALAAATVALAMLARSPGWSRSLATTVAALAVVADAAGWSRPLYRFLLPPAGLILLALALGALMGLVVARTASDPFRRLGAPQARLARAAAGFVALVLLVGLLTTPVAGFIKREVPIGITLGNPAEAALRFLDTQRGWTQTTTRVLVGPYFNAFFAGPTLSHPLGYVGTFTSCETLRRAHHTAWIVLQDSGDAPSWMMPAFHKASCLPGIKPAYRAGLVTVFAPG